MIQVAVLFAKLDAQALNGFADDMMNGKGTIMLLTRKQIKDFCNRDWIRPADPLETADLCETTLFYMDVTRALGQFIKCSIAGTNFDAAAEIRKLSACMRK